MSEEDLYKDNYKIVYGYLLSLSGNSKLSEELASDVFYKAISHLEQFDGKCKISTWLCQIAKNEYFKYYNKSKKRKSISEIDEYEENFEKKFIDKETAMEIHMHLHKLQEPYKEVFCLRIFAELSYADIGKIFGKTEGWARVTYYRAKSNIVQLIAKRGDI